MLKLVIRGISASKGRLALTMLSIIFGVAFVSGSFVLADSLRSVFDKVSSDIFAGIDAQVRAVPPEVTNTENEVRFDESLATDLANVDGVEELEAGISGFEVVYSIDAEGEIIRPQGPPVLTFSWGGPSGISAFTLVEGSAPVGQQVALDVAQANAGDFAIGDLVDISTTTGAIEQFELASTIEFGSPGAYFILFDLPTAQRVLDAPGQIDGIAVSALEGVSPNVLVENLQAAVPAEIEVISAETAIGETQDEFGSFIDIFGNILLGFALVTLFVSIFIIYNTFAILVSQRTKQMGLLRAIGASSSQVRGMVLIESLVIGLVASILGLIAGIGVAAGLKWLFSQGGGTFPDGPLELKTRTIVVVMIVGVLVTVLAAIIPAVKASRISPLEAIADLGAQERSMRFRIIAGSLVLFPGIILLGLGLAGTSGSTSGVLAFLGSGSMLTFIGVSMLSALFAGKASSALGAPVEALRGTVGRISRDNASRNPQRTSATATALMIGLALITGVSVLAASIKATFNDLLGDALAADLFIFEEAQGLTFSPTLAEQLQALPEVESAVGFSELEAVVDFSSADDGTDRVSAFDVSTGPNILAVEMLEGELTASGVAIREDTAADNDITVGQNVALTFDDGEPIDFEVTGIYDQGVILEGNYIVDRTIAAPRLNVDNIDFVGVNYVDGVDSDVARERVDEVAAAYPQLSVQDNTEFQENVEGQVNSILIVINGLLGLCLIIAFFGIINTMALSVLERTREIGLLRAVGMTQRQLRSSIRWEAVIVSLFGTLLGVFMGVVLARAGISALPEGFITATAIPWVSLAVYILLGVILGIVAAYFPARRAAKLDVLQAIATS